MTRTVRPLNTETQLMIMIHRQRLTVTPTVERCTTHTYDGHPDAAPVDQLPIQTHG